VAAVVVFFVLTPKVPKSTPTLPTATQYQSLIQQALADDTANNVLTQGAPQQTVVNGWTARDLLTIIAKENQDILTAQGAVVDATGTLQTTPFDDRVPALLLIGVIALCWAGVSAPRQSFATFTAGPMAPAPLPG
jgi:hypothetical protein